MIALGGIALAGVGVVAIHQRPPTNTPPEEFSVEVANSEDSANGLGAIRRHPSAEHGLTATPSSNSETLYQTFQHGLRLSRDQPCMGRRPMADGKAGDFIWETYEEVSERIENLGSGIVNMGMIPPTKGTAITGEMRLMAFFLNNCPEWAIAEQALYRHGGTTVPLYATLGPEAVSQIVGETEPTTVLCTLKELPHLREALPKCPTVKNLIVVGKVSEEDRAGWPNEIKVHSFGEVEANGKENPQEANPCKASDVATFCYTSGSTGRPKGVVLTHQSVVANVAAVESYGVPFLPSDRHLSYLPLAHGFERVLHSAFFFKGSRVGYSQGDTLKIPDDIKALRPTVFPSVPRLLNRMYDKITQLAHSGGIVKSTIYDLAYASKQEGLKKGWVTNKFWDALVFKKISAKAGLGEARIILTGSAPIAPHVMEFLRIVFCCPVSEGYGQTELTAGATVSHPFDYSTGHVGGPLACTEIRLQSVDGMDYKVTDQEHRGTKCAGRGEILFRGPNAFSCYYKMDDKTKETIDDEGWVHSGDIGLWTSRGALKIIDRKKNIFKLAQGEYVAPEKIENSYLKCELVTQVFVHGCSFQSALVAIVVPDEHQLKNLAKALGVETEDYAEICQNAEVKKALQEQMEATGKGDGLHGFERVKDIHIEKKPWTADDLLTPTFKLKRVPAREYYGKQIDDMYAVIGHIAGSQTVKQQ